jgi:hypothetical protein
MGVVCVKFCSCLAWPHGDSACCDMNSGGLYTNALPFVFLRVLTRRTSTCRRSSRHRGQETGQAPNITTGGRHRSGSQPHSLNGRQQNRCKAATADTKPEHRAGPPSTLSRLSPSTTAGNLQHNSRCQTEVGHAHTDRAAVCPLCWLPRWPVYVRHVT